ncbi:MAG: bacillithiol system redox-active protein YtxJ [Flavobacteriaceae bacterium]|nr:bacillithiol system redox-active protein YtxJ [Flavobacteriaceae bacterium]
MGILKNIFGSTSNQEENTTPWKNLTSTNQLDAIVEKSSSKIQIIFKHSTRCGISSMVKRQFERQYSLNGEADLYYLDILNYRNISNEISNRFQVYHESPQLLIIKNGVVVKHDSHGSINDMNLITIV